VPSPNGNIVKVYTDRGISSVKGRDRRPQFDAMHRDAARREFDCIMACRWTGSAARCKIWSPSSQKSTRSASTSICTSRVSTPRHQRVRSCFRCLACLANSNAA
jgi:hypothetical protein